MTTIRIYRGARREWMCHTVRTFRGQVFEDWVWAGVESSLSPEKVLETVAGCNVGCDVEMDEERCG